MVSLSDRPPNGATRTPTAVRDDATGDDQKGDGGAGPTRDPDAAINQSE